MEKSKRFPFDLPIFESEIVYKCLKALAAVASESLKRSHIYSVFCKDPDNCYAMKIDTLESYPYLL